MIIWKNDTNGFLLHYTTADRRCSGFYQVLCTIFPYDNTGSRNFDGLLKAHFRRSFLQVHACPRNEQVKNFSGEYDVNKATYSLNLVMIMIYIT